MQCNAFHTQMFKIKTQHSKNEKIRAEMKSKRNKHKSTDEFKNVCKTMGVARTHIHLQFQWNYLVAACAKRKWNRDLLIAADSTVANSNELLTFSWRRRLRPRISSLAVSNWCDSSTCVLRNAISSDSMAKAVSSSSARDT